MHCLKIYIYLFVCLRHLSRLSHLERRVFPLPNGSIQSKESIPSRLYLYLYYSCKRRIDLMPYLFPQSQKIESSVMIMLTFRNESSSSACFSIQVSLRVCTGRKESCNSNTWRGQTIQAMLLEQEIFFSHIDVFFSCEIDLISVKSLCNSYKILAFQTYP